MTQQRLRDSHNWVPDPAGLCQALSEMNGVVRERDNLDLFFPFIPATAGTQLKLNFNVG